MNMAVSSLTMAIFPVLYFFTFLFYTDSGSTFFVLFTYLMTLHRNHLLAGILGAFAILFRQTNIVWVGFCACISLIPIIYEFAHINKKDVRSGFQVYKSFVKAARGNRNNLIHFITVAVDEVWPYAITILVFLAFFASNGSIVVGAKDDHPAGLHFPQLFYFSAFNLAFVIMHVDIKTSLASFSTFLKRHLMLAAAIGLVSILLVHNFTMEHRYLLSDNRHYTFYIWKDIIKRHETVRYLLVPGYLFAIFTAVNMLKTDLLWKLAYCACVIANLVPSTLIEFRYFIIPYLIFRLNIGITTYTRVMIEFCIFLTINLFTLYMFLERPFRSGEENSEVQRFMW